MILYKSKDGTVSSAAPVKPRVIKKRKSRPINDAGFSILNRFKEYLLTTPNQSAKEIAANFSDINFHTIRYHLARAVKYQHLFVTTDNIPLYNVNPDKVFNGF